MQRQGGVVKRGVGIAAHSFGIGGAGDKAKLAIEINPDDGITVYAASADPGEGNDSMLAQIAAHQLKVPLDKIRLYTRDTDKTVLMGPAAGSRMTFMAGHALLNAIANLETAMAEAGSRTYADLVKAGKPTRYDGIQQEPRPGGIDKQTGQGNAQVTEVHNIQMAEVEVEHRRPGRPSPQDDRRRGRGDDHQPARLRGPAGRGHGPGRRLCPPGGIRPRPDERLESIQFPTIRDTFDIEDRSPCRRPARTARWGDRHRGDDDGLHRSGGHQCHLQRLRRQGLQPARYPGQSEGGLAGK